MRNNNSRYTEQHVFDSYTAGMYKRNALWDRVSMEVQHVIVYFMLERRNNVVSTTTTKTQIVK